MSEIGIVGGTFDPFHFGHLSIAEAAIKEFDLSEVILLPTKVQPFKIGREMASEEDRVNMVRLIAKENKQFRVSTIEAYGQRVSYTYKTLKLLQKEYPDDKFYFILGTDSFLTLEEWFKGKELLQEFAFIIGVRPGYKTSETEDTAKRLKERYNAEIKMLHNEIVEVSSTEIKNNIRSGKSIRDLVPLQVERYIDEHGLYK